MSRRKLTPEKRNVIANLIEMYEIKTAADLQNASKELLGDTIQEMLETELDEELGYKKYEKTIVPKTNYRNGHKPKTLKSTAGEIEINVPQDRNSEIEPKIVPKYKTRSPKLSKNYKYVRQRFNVVCYFLFSFLTRSVVMNKLKVLFVNLPPYPLDQLTASDSARASYIVPPMGLMYLADRIDKEYIHWVKCLDFSLLSYSSIKSLEEYEAFIEARLLNYVPDVVCISLTFSASYDFFEIVAGSARKHWDKSVIIVGGVHATNTPDFILNNNQAVDYVICGEGEKALPELLYSLSLCLEKEKLKNIQGVHFKGNIKYAALNEFNEFKFERARLPKDINIDFAKYPIVFDMDRYTQNVDIFTLAKTDINFKYFPLMVSRGCPMECVFCSAHTVHGRRPRWRDTDNILEEIIWLHKNYGVNKIHLMDDNFVPKNKALELFRVLAKVEIADFEVVILNMSVNFTDKDVIDAVAAAKIKNITFAIESGSPKIQKKIKKHCDLEKAKELINYCREKRIETRCFYMLGFPGETMEQMQETIEYASKVGANWSSFNIAVPLPGSKMYSEFINLGCIQDGPAFWKTINYKDRTFDTPEIKSLDLKELMHTADLKLNFLNSPYLAKSDKANLIKAENIFKDFISAFDFHIFGHDCLRRVYQLMGDDDNSQKTLNHMKHLINTNAKAKEFIRYIHLLEEEVQKFLTP